MPASESARRPNSSGWWIYLGFPDSNMDCVLGEGKQGSLWKQNEDSGPGLRPGHLSSPTVMNRTYGQ